MKLEVGLMSKLRIPVVRENQRKLAMGSTDINTAWQMLQVIPADDYEIWLRCGMALKDEFGEQGYQLFLEWSKQAHNFSQSAVDSTWKSIRRSGVTIGTLIFFAKEHGWNSECSANIDSYPVSKEAPKQCTPDTRPYAVDLWS